MNFKKMCQNQLTKYLALLGDAAIIMAVFLNLSCVMNGAHYNDYVFTGSVVKYVYNV